MMHLETMDHNDKNSRDQSHGSWLGGRSKLIAHASCFFMEEAILAQCSGFRLHSEFTSMVGGGDNPLLMFPDWVKLIY